MRRTVVGVFVCVVAIGALSIDPAPASGVAGVWLRPLAGPVVRGFVAPLTRYGAGHLGVDFAVAPGTAVHAAGPGTVVFAGLVAGARHVVLRHPGGRRTSYSFLASIRVRTGQVVARGAVLGTSGGHGENHAAGVLHFGLRIGETFVDPMLLFPPGAPPVRVHLAPAERLSGHSTGRAAERKALVASVAGPPAPVLVLVSESPDDPDARAVPVCAHLVALRRPEPGDGPFRPG
jgi:murein DD-endopeptidase MepM/ murein hydrolase activator NlpD